MTDAAWGQWPVATVGLVEAAILVAFVLGVLIGIVLVHERKLWHEMRAAAPLTLNEPANTHVPDRRSTTS